MSRGEPYLGYQRRLRSIDRRRLLKPYASSELIDTSLRLYQRIAWPVLRATAAPMLLCLVALTFYAGFVIPGFFTSSAADLPGELAEIGLVTVIGLGVALPLFATGLGLSAVQTVPLVSQQVMGEIVPRRGGGVALQATVSMVACALVVLVLTIGPALLFGFGMVLGMVAERTGTQNMVTDVVSGLSIVGLYTLGWALVPLGLHYFGLAPVVSVLEGSGPWAAVKRSARLVRSVRWQTAASGATFGAALLLGLLGIALFTALQMLVGAFDLARLVDRHLMGTGLSQLAAGAVSSLPGYLTLWFLVPVWTAVCTVLYYDRRVRLEAFDIQVLTADIESENETRRTVLLP